MERGGVLSCNSIDHGNLLSCPSDISKVAKLIFYLTNRTACLAHSLTSQYSEPTGFILREISSFGDIFGKTSVRSDV